MKFYIILFLCDASVTIDLVLYTYKKAERHIRQKIHAKENENE